MDTFKELELSAVPSQDFAVNSIVIPGIENLPVNTSSSPGIHKDEYELKQSEIKPTKTQDESNLEPLEYDTQESSKLDDLSNGNTFENESIVELSRHSWGTEEQFYLQGCKWSPDQTCILTAVNKNGMHIFELPHDLYDMEIASLERSVDILQSVVSVKENGTIYDYCWYPNMNSLIPATCW